jgi:hypothetical protein
MRASAGLTSLSGLAVHGPWPIDPLYTLTRKRLTFWTVASRQRICGCIPPLRRAKRSKPVCQKPLECAHSELRTEPSSQEPVTQRFQSGRLELQDSSGLPGLPNDCRGARNAQALVLTQRRFPRPRFAQAVRQDHCIFGVPDTLPGPGLASKRAPRLRSRVTRPRPHHRRGGRSTMSFCKTAGSGVPSRISGPGAAQSRHSATASALVWLVPGDAFLVRNQSSCPGPQSQSPNCDPAPRASNAERFASTPLSGRIPRQQV